MQQITGTVVLTLTLICTVMQKQASQSSTYVALHCQSFIQQQPDAWARWVRQFANVRLAFALNWKQKLRDFIRAQI
jgi:hypothetical protein